MSKPSKPSQPSQPSTTVTRHLPLRARMLKGQSLTVISRRPLRALIAGTK
jgi:hypothetical protein